MGKYCPTWVFDCIVAQCTIDFIELGHGLELICKKYSDGLQNFYEDIYSKELEESTKVFLKLLSDYEINENSIVFLQNFSFYRFNYTNRYLKRNFKSIFTNPFTSNKKRLSDDDNNLAYIQSFLFEWRSTANLKAKPGWSLATQSDFPELSSLVNKPLSDQERKILLREARKNEFQETWVKK